MIKKQSSFLITLYSIFLCSALIHLSQTYGLKETKQEKSVRDRVSCNEWVKSDFTTCFNAQSAREFCSKECTCDAIKLYRPIYKIHQPMYRSRSSEDIIALSVDASRVIMSSDQVRIIEFRKDNAWSTVACFDKDSTSSVAMSADGNRAVIATCLGATHILGRMADGTWTKMPQKSPEFNLRVHCLFKCF